MRRHVKASSAESTSSQATGLGRFFRGALATRGSSSRSLGGGARSSRRAALVLGVLVLAVAVSLGSASAIAVTHPTLTIDPPSDVGYGKAHFSGTIDPEGGDEAFYWGFEFSTEPGNPESWSGGSPSGYISLPEAEGTDPISVAGDNESLQPGTEYSVRLATHDEATYSLTAVSNVLTFTTLDTTAPAVTLEPPTSVTTTSAHVEGTINPGGSDPAFNVNWHFECTPACPQSYSGEITADNSIHTVEADLKGLDPNTAYEVTLVASNVGHGATAGPEAFTTDATIPKAMTIPAFAGGGGSATLGAEVDPQGSATTYWFEYGTDTSYGTVLPASEDGEAGSGGQPGVPHEGDQRPRAGNPLPLPSSSSKRTGDRLRRRPVLHVARLERSKRDLSERRIPQWSGERAPRLPGL